MIANIKELNFPPYATLNTATVTMQDMGENTITAQVKIDGNIKPDFSYDWEVEFDGERYIHAIRSPQASKENTSLSSSIELTFRHWAVHELKRYYFVEMAHIDAGTAIANNYIASMSLNIKDFIVALNNVLEYYYGGKIVAELADGDYSDERVFVEISNSYIWDVIAKVYETYGVRWHIESENGTCKIKFGYPVPSIGHVFEYGFNGGLLKVERQVQSDNIRNIILGRGGDKNLPYRYFKAQDPNNPTFPADPDCVPELENIFFSELRDSAFRSYVQGWKAKHYGGLVTRNKAAVGWAYDKGYTDEKFNPVEYVKDDDSIKRYGELWGALANNEEIFPTIQGMIRGDIGRVDQVVDVEQIESDDDAETKVESYTTELEGAEVTFNAEPKKTTTIRTSRVNFSVREGMKADIRNGGVSFTAMTTYDKPTTWQWYEPTETHDTTSQTIVTLTDIKVYNEQTGAEHTANAIPSGNWYYIATLEVENNVEKTDKFNHTEIKAKLVDVELYESNKWGDDRHLNTFDIWVKNIWETQKASSESDADYVKRVWTPILGNHLGDEAKVVFSSGLLSISQDYEFTMVAPLTESIHYDTSKSLDGVQSHWRLTLAKSDADLDTLGVLLPNSNTNAVAGDFFFFIGIDIPYLYYTDAEVRLTEYKEESLGETKDIKPTWVVTLDKVRIANKQVGEVETLLSQIKSGSSLKLADKRFIDDKEELFIQSITYNYNEPTSDSPALIPDVEIVLSDKIQTTANPVEELQGKVDIISNALAGLTSAGDKYLRKDGVSDSSQSPTAFNAPVNFNSDVSSRGFQKGASGTGWGFSRDEFLKWLFEVDEVSVRDKIRGALKIGDCDDGGKSFSDGTSVLGDDLQLKIGGNARIDNLLLALAGIYTNLIKSDNFSGDGLLDSGFQLTKDDGTGHSYMVVDKLYVRLKAIFNELEIRKVSYAGGNFIFSHAGSKIVAVMEMDNAYRCYLLSDDGTTSTENWWKVDDQARCQTFNIEAGVHKNVENKYYWRRVVAIGKEPYTDGVVYDYIDLSKSDSDGDDAPEGGDQIVQMGNRTDAERQGFISLEVSGEYAPALKVYKGVNSYNTEGKRKICLSPKMTEIRAQRFIIETEYDSQIVPLERGEWNDIPEHKCYYYDLVQHNGGTWLCVYPENGIGGVAYTTEEPSYTATYWKVYAQAGISGESAFVVDIDNEMSSVALDQDGKTDSSYDITINISAYYGTKNVTSQCAITENHSDKNIGVDISNTGSVKIHINNGVVISDKNDIVFTVSHSQYGSRNIVFTLAGVRAGADGKPATMYEISPNLNSISFARNADGSLTPSSRTLSVDIIVTQGDSVSVKSINESGLIVRYSTISMPPNATSGSAFSSLTVKSSDTFTNVYIAAFKSGSGTLVDRETIPVIKDGNNGDDGQGSFKSIVFVRSAVEPKTPSGGTYSNPLPSGWYDGIPAEDGNPVWMSSRIFTTDGLSPQEQNWATPRKVADTADIDFEFSSVETNPGNPTDNPSNWHDKATENDIWMAVRKQSNGVWGRWEVSKIKGEKGEEGKPGKDGKDGTSVTYDEEHSSISYAISSYGVAGAGRDYPSDISSWSASVPSPQKGKYLWVQDITAYKSGDKVEYTITYGVSYYGTDGQSVEIDTSRTYVRYSSVHTASRPADSTFTLTSPPSLASGDYLWILSQVAYVGVSEPLKSYSVSRIGTDGSNGDPGADGYTTHFAYAKLKTGQSIPSDGKLTTAMVDSFSTTNFSSADAIGTYRDQKSTDSTNIADYTWSQFKGDRGENGKDGTSVTIASTSVTYQAHTNGTTAPTGTWLASPPATTAGQYLWTRTIVTYSDGKSTTSYSVSYMGTNGTNGTNGATITSSSVTYAVTSTASQPADSAFTSSSVPSVSVGSYLWSKTEVIYSNGVVTKSYSVSRIGSDGEDGLPGSPGADGKTTYVHIAYANNATGTIGFSTTYFNGALYIGTCTDYNEKDPTTPTSYEWARLRGEDGADGKGILSTVVTYQVSNSGTTVPTGTWYSTPQATMAGQYLWTRTVITYTDNSSTTLYSVSAHGADGRSYTENLLLNSNKRQENDSYLIASYYLGEEKPVEGDIYTITIKGKLGGKKTSFMAYNSGASIYEGTLYEQSEGIYQLKGFAWVISRSGTVAANTHINVYTYPNTETSTCVIEWIKLEKGVVDANNVVWTPNSSEMIGQDGKGISSITEYYLATSASSGVTSSTSGWTTTVQTMDATKQYLWNYEETLYTDGSKTTTQPVIIGRYGQDGADGADYSPNMLKASNVEKKSKNYNIGDYYYDVKPEAGKTYTLTLCYKCGERTTQISASHYGGSLYEPTVFTSKVKTVESKVFVVKDHGSLPSVMVFYNLPYLGSGQDGNYNDDTIVYWALLQEGDTGNQTNWLPAASEMVGTAGRGITNIINYYAVTTTQTAPSVPAASSAPSSPWQTTPPAMSSTNKYLWNYERIQYSSGTIWEATTPHIVAVYGDKGADGTNGKTLYTWVKYADDANGNGMSDSPLVGNVLKKYIGFAYNKETPVESNNPSDYSWALFKGTDGTNGLPGEPGKDGKTLYTWIKYADSLLSNGYPSSMYDTPKTSTEYIGIAVNNETQTEGTDPTAYTWSKFKGDQGVPGKDGTNGKDGKDGSSITSKGSAKGFVETEDDLKRIFNEKGSSAIGLWLQDDYGGNCNLLSLRNGGAIYVEKVEEGDAYVCGGMGESKYDGHLMVFTETDPIAGIFNWVDMGKVSGSDGVSWFFEPNTIVLNEKLDQTPEQIVGGAMPTYSYNVPANATLRCNVGGEMAVVTIGTILNPAEVSCSLYSADTIRITKITPFNISSDERYRVYCNATAKLGDSTFSANNIGFDVVISKIGTAFLTMINGFVGIGVMKNDLTQVGMYLDATDKNNPHIDMIGNQVRTFPSGANTRTDTPRFVLSGTELNVYNPETKQRQIQFGIVDGNVVMRYFRRDGTFLYDLGPDGLIVQKSQDASVVIQQMLDVTLALKPLDPYYYPKDETAALKVICNSIARNYSQITSDNGYADCYHVYTPMNVGLYPIIPAGSYSVKTTNLDTGVEGTMTIRISSQVSSEVSSYCDDKWMSEVVLAQDGYNSQMLGSDNKMNYVYVTRQKMVWLGTKEEARDYQNVLDGMSTWSYDAQSYSLINWNNTVYYKTIRCFFNGVIIKEMKVFMN